MNPTTAPGGGLQLPNDIEGLLAYGFPWGLVAGIAGVVVCLIVLLAWAWRRWRRRGEAVVVEPPRDPLKDALADLARLKVPDPMTHAAAVEFCFKATLYFRRALEAATGIAATDMTQRELGAGIAAGPFPQEIDRAELLGKLAVADLVKFAERPFEPVDAQSLQDDLMAWGRKLSDYRDERLQIAAERLKQSGEQGDVTGGEAK